MMKKMVMVVAAIAAITGIITAAVTVIAKKRN